MVSTQSQYDIEYVYGEFGDSYTIQILNDDGTSSDISWADAAKMTVTKYDGTVLFSVTQATGLTITSPNIIWAMTAAHTTALTYDGKIKVQIQLTSSTTKKRRTKIFNGFIFSNQVAA